MTDIQQVRLLIADTGSIQFTDAEIQIFLDLAGGSVLTAAGYALEAWAASVTGGLTSERIGDYSYSKKDAEEKLKLAMEYKKEDAEKPYLTWSEIDLTYGSGITEEED